MAVYTKLNSKEINNILNEYDIGSCIQVDSLKNGTVQTNIKIKTTKNKFAVKLYEHRTFEYVRFEVNVLKYLHKHSFPCPIPIANKYGAYIVPYKKKPCVIYTYIAGKHNKKLSKRQYQTLVKHLAWLHTITKGYKPKYWSHRESHDIEYCRQMTKDEAKRFSNKTIAKQRVQWVESELKKLRFPNTLPKGVCHCDFDISNIKFDKENITGVLDFDDACYTHLIFDIGALLYYWAWLRKDEFDMKTAKFLVKEYEKTRTLNLSEKKHIYDALKIVVFTYMSWLLYDGESKDFFKKSKQRIEWLNHIGRDNFYKELFT